MAIPEWDIASEIRLLEEILVELPEEEVIERIGFEHRLAEAKKQIANMQPESFRHRDVLEKLEHIHLAKTE